jgi:hypothetical protein
MTAKEKAQELFDNFFIILIKRGEHHYTFDYTKQCALIACDEVLGYMGADRGTEFWQEVKQEIEKL